MWNFQQFLLCNFQPKNSKNPYNPITSSTYLSINKNKDFHGKSNKNQLETLCPSDSQWIFLFSHSLFLVSVKYCVVYTSHWLVFAWKCPRFVYLVDYVVVGKWKFLSSSPQSVQSVQPDLWKVAENSISHVFFVMSQILQALKNHLIFIHLEAFRSFFLQGGWIEMRRKNEMLLDKTKWKSISLI